MNYRNGLSAILNGQDKEPEAPKKPHWRITKWYTEDLDKETHKKLYLLHNQLLKFNKTINLVSDNTLFSADELHFADSIEASWVLLKNTDHQTIYDIGSGNGFPGLVLAVLAPERQIVLLDKDLRKIEYLKMMVARLGLKNCQCLGSSFEDIPDNSLECAISRGFAPLSKALLLARKKFKAKGQYFHMKTDSWGSEVSQIPPQICSQWTTNMVGEYELPHTKRRYCLLRTNRAGD